MDTRQKSIITALLLIAFLFSHIAAVSAQSVTVLGEVTTRGRVFIESSSGQWLPAPATYPLIQNTGIKTDDGSASIYFKDGSRVDISKNSFVMIDGIASEYSMQMNKGVLAFNVTPSSSLTVRTPSTVITANAKSPSVKLVNIENSGRVLGIISTTEKGTEIRSISGRLMVDVSSSDTKLVSTGESIFIDSNGKYNVYKTQAVTQGSAAPAVTGISNVARAQVIVGGLMAASVTGLSIYALQGQYHKIASPSGF